MRLAILLLIASSAFGQAHYAHHGDVLLPDPVYSPGVANPEVTQANIHKTICVPGWAEKVRPPSSYTAKIKKEQMLLYGDTVPQVPPLGKPPDVTKCVSHSNDARCYEEDHIWPIEDAGHPTDPHNLYPQPYWPRPGAHEKDQLENDVHRQLCSTPPKMLLEDAAEVFRPDWVTPYLKMEATK